MPLSRPTLLNRSHGRGALWSSLFGMALVAAVVGGNLWSIWHAEPEPATLDPLQRLSALRQEQGAGRQTAAGLPANAVASAAEDGQGSLDASTVSGRGTPVHETQATGPGNRRELTRSCTVQPGESLGAALGHLFIQGAVQRQVIEAYAKLRKPERLQAGWRLYARFSAEGGAALADSAALLSVVIAPGHGEGVTVSRTDRAVDGKLRPDGKNLDAEFAAADGGLPGTVLRRPLRCPIAGAVDVSLRRCGGDEALALQVGMVLADRLHPAVELKAGDELRLVVDELMDGDVLLRHLQIAALQVRPFNGQAVTALRFADGEGTDGYYAPTGDSVEAMFMRQPLRSGRTTSGFGMRLHPILHEMKAHYGVDFAAATGTPVYAAADGALISAHKAGAAGNLVRLRHGDGYATEYMHLQKFAPGLQAGDRVEKGQLIGFVGSTGRSTGPHLHFGVKKNGKYCNPVSISDALQPGLGARQKRTFEAQAAVLMGILNGLDRTKPASGS